MAKVRRLLVPVAIAWLFLHVSVVMGTTSLLIAAGHSTRELVCTCAHGGDHGSCPMHQTPADSARCHVQSTQHDLGLALMAVIGSLPAPAAGTAANINASSPGPIGYTSPIASDWLAPPDSPPPRT